LGWIAGDIDYIPSIFDTSEILKDTDDVKRNGTFGRQNIYTVTTVFEAFAGLRLTNHTIPLAAKIYR
jgi:hypothetical protein